MFQLFLSRYVFEIYKPNTSVPEAFILRKSNESNAYKKGIIIAGRYDKKLDYALEYAPNDTEVFIYNVSFTLNEFKK